MNAHQLEAEQAACAAKRRYPNSHQALNAAWLYAIQHGRQAAYRCPHCGHYHVTSDVGRAEAGSSYACAWQPNGTGP